MCKCRVSGCRSVCGLFGEVFECWGVVEEVFVCVEEVCVLMEVVERLCVVCVE